MGAIIDTSVWIDAFHPKTPKDVKVLATECINRADALLCEPVFVEFFSGVPDRELARAENYLGTVPILPTPQSLWREALPLLRNCMKAGTPVGTLDALIAVIALKNAATVITFDKDFLILQDQCGVGVQLLVRPEKPE